MNRRERIERWRDVATCAWRVADYRRACAAAARESARLARAQAQALYALRANTALAVDSVAVALRLAAPPVAPVAYGDRFALIELE